eukprot:CAMPEP_0171246378 /NCGR_PEP_ID=MMETSP0790-20130122/47917_1 /TAXON_ID=2925 /ORGANISM="Alexandrium catenella, Strain OF101" /LENGTH=68 /DNA_ID=CAMNT_0011713691 /DNA_START=46 /DNA_END=249 /DNA_ORIENTATION=-
MEELTLPSPDIGRSSRLESEQSLNDGLGGQTILGTPSATMSSRRLRGAPSSAPGDAFFAAAPQRGGVA